LAERNVTHPARFITASSHVVDFVAEEVDHVRHDHHAGPLNLG